MSSTHKAVISPKRRPVPTITRRRSRESSAMKVSVKVLNSASVSQVRSGCSALMVGRDGAVLAQGLTVMSACSSTAQAKTPKSRPW